MDEGLFWSTIEAAWEDAGSLARERALLAAGELSYEEAEAIAEAAGGMVEALRARLGALSAEDLMAFDRILERELYDLDRADVHEALDGSDDGFLYGRGFVVAAGRAYYDAVAAEPTRAHTDLECEEMCYVSWHVYREKFGDMPASGISRETGSNAAGWAE